MRTIGKKSVTTLYLSHVYIPQHSSDIIQETYAPIPNNLVCQPVLKEC